jgi:hypothetical protein
VWQPPLLPGSPQTELPRVHVPPSPAHNETSWSGIGEREHVRMREQMRMGGGMVKKMAPAQGLIMSNDPSARVGSVHAATPAIPLSSPPLPPFPLPGACHPVDPWHHVVIHSGHRSVGGNGVFIGVLSVAVHMGRTHRIRMADDPIPRLCLGASSPTRTHTRFHHHMGCRRCRGGFVGHRRHLLATASEARSGCRVVVASPAPTPLPIQCIR